MFSKYTLCKLYSIKVPIVIPCPSPSKCIQYLQRYWFDIPTCTWKECTHPLILSLPPPLLVHIQQPSLLSSHWYHCARESGGNSVLDTGGWCLAPGGASDVIEYGNIKFSIPQNHVSASKRISSELLAFIDKEGIKSVNDFGAGVGQYKHAILSKRPNIEWNSYVELAMCTSIRKALLNILTYLCH